MELLFNYCESMGCLKSLSFDFSLARGLDYYTGLIYEAVMEEGEALGSIAGGGRYDNLVGMFAKKQIKAVGGSIGIERMFLLLEAQAKKRNDVRATQTQILVATIGKGYAKEELGMLVSEKLKILNELWADDLKAESLYLENPKP
jgi:histidyl-tRNA synthetase